MFDHRAEAEISVLIDVVARVDAALADAARYQQHPGSGRARIYATVLYELIVSARQTHGPDAGRLYAAPILDSLIEDIADADERTLLDLLVPEIVARRVTAVN
ncbi:hypothetical protein AB0B25_18105 [Nocardia sp. NPDC049190]|uniref:hypothetical protein n=1 Tax=Nocardia sp. NPDC049190 TaxID=3155650 RepID=UPI0034013BFA